MEPPPESLIFLLKTKGGKGFREVRYSAEQIERMTLARRVWVKERSLRAVAEALGVSGERARQILDKGSALGLYPFEPRRRGPGAITVHLVMDWPKVIQAQRTRLALNTEDFARLLGFSRVTISNWEAGKRNPGARARKALVSISKLLKRAAWRKLRALDFLKATADLKPEIPAALSPVAEAETPGS